MTSVFGYVARTSSRAETDATKALEFILETSQAHEIAKAGFANLLRRIEPRLPILTRFHTDPTRTGKGTPDLIGSDRADQLWAVIENKFHAPLTAHQPGGYLAKLPQGGLLLFIVPDFRQRPIQRTLDEKLPRDWLEPRLWDHPAEPRGISRREIDGRTVAVTTWAVVLTAMLPLWQPSHALRGSSRPKPISGNSKACAMRWTSGLASPRCPSIRLQAPRPRA